MSWTRLAAAAIVLPLLMPAAHASDLAETGGVPFVKTTVVVPTSTVAGIDNVGRQSVGNIANGGIGSPGVRIRYGNGVSAPVVDTTVVVPTQVVAGIDNAGFQQVGNIANSGPRLLLRRR